LPVEKPWLKVSMGVNMAKNAPVLVRVSAKKAAVWRGQRFAAKASLRCRMEVELAAAGGVAPIRVAPEPEVAHVRHHCEES
jgi:hypothetical protein